MVLVSSVAKLKLSNIRHLVKFTGVQMSVEGIL